MKTKKEIEEFVNERLENLRKDLLEFIFDGYDDNIVKNVFNDNSHILNKKDYIDFTYPSEIYDIDGKREKFIIRFTKSNNCISAYYNDELVFNGNKETFNRQYMGKQIQKRYDVIKNKRKDRDIQFNGSAYFLARTIFEKISFKTSLNESKVKNFIIDVIKPYLIENVFFKD